MALQPSPLVLNVLGRNCGLNGYLVMQSLLVDLILCVSSSLLHCALIFHILVSPEWLQLTTCFNCGMIGHYASKSPYDESGDDEENSGRTERIRRSINQD